MAHYLVNHRGGLFRETPEPADLPFPGDNSLAMVGVEPIAESCEFDPATGRRSCE